MLGDSVLGSDQVSFARQRCAFVQGSLLFIVQTKVGASKRDCVNECCVCVCVCGDAANRTGGEGSASSVQHCSCKQKAPDIPTDSWVSEHQERIGKHLILNKRRLC